MSASDGAPAGWQRGSFRGVAFVTEDQEQSGGRRLVVHEFPQADDPVIEDLGRKASRFTIACHIIGDGWFDRATRFADALDAAGVATLVHPWLGAMQVAVDDFSRRDSTSEGGMASFSVQFVKSGQPASAQPTADTGAIAKATADMTASAAPQRFADRFSVTGATAFVEKAAATLVSKAALATAIQGGLLGGAGPALRAFQVGLGALGGSAVLVRNALDLGLTTVGLIQTVSVLGGSVTAKVHALGTLLDFGNDLPPVNTSTPSRLLEHDNQAAFVQLVNITAATELVRIVADAPFASYQDAIGLRDTLADRFDVLALRQSDLGDDDGAADFDLLRRAMVRDVTARGGTLARLQGYTPATTEPALVIAHRLYDDVANVSTRAREIVDRNRIAHPGFVTGGVALQVVTPDSVEVGRG